MNILENTEKWANFDTLIQKKSANFEFFSFLAKIGGGGNNFFDRIFTYDDKVL